MKWHIRYPRAKAAFASIRGYAVFVVGFYDGNRSEFSRMLDPGMASALYSFAVMVSQGKAPREAFDAITWPDNKKIV
jgi:hypothetical protein